MIAHRWISTFLEAQAAESGAAENTLLGYGRDLKAFADWLERSRHDIATADRNAVEAYEDGEDYELDEDDYDSTIITFEDYAEMMGLSRSDGISFT